MYYMNLPPGSVPPQTIFLVAFALVIIDSELMSAGPHHNQACFHFAICVVCFMIIDMECSCLSYMTESAK